MPRGTAALLVGSFLVVTVAACYLLHGHVLRLAARDAVNDFDKAFGPDLAIFGVFFRSRQRALSSLADAIGAVGRDNLTADLFAQVVQECAWRREWMSGGGGAGWQSAFSCRGSWLIRWSENRNSR
jgi:hypothetical protein